jgi:hypothetical protein
MRHDENWEDWVDKHRCAAHKVCGAIDDLAEFAARRIFKTEHEDCITDPNFQMKLDVALKLAQLAVLTKQRFDNFDFMIDAPDIDLPR